MSIFLLQQHIVCSDMNLLKNHKNVFKSLSNFITIFLLFLSILINECVSHKTHPYCKTKKILSRTKKLVFKTKKLILNISKLVLNTNKFFSLTIFTKSDLRILKILLRILK